MATQISIDLGSYKTVIAEGYRIALEQPSIVTVDVDSFTPVYFGDKAKSSLGRTPETLTCIRPIERGVIADYDLTFAMLCDYMKNDCKMKEEYEIFNVGTGRPVSVYELVTAFEKVNGLKLNYKFAPRRPGDVVAIWADTAHANEELGWKAERTVEETLASAWAWEKFIANK